MIVLVSQWDIAETGTNVIDRETALTNQLTVLIEHSNPEEG